MARACIGTSGWQYPGFRTRFYPSNLASSDLLGYYSQRLNTVEINSTFYHFSRPTTYINWRITTASDFTIALKAHRYFTHWNRLGDPLAKLGDFLANARLLGEKLGPILFQSPPSLTKDAAKLKDFLARLPRDLRFAMEFRDASWETAQIYGILADHGVALCVHDLRQVLSPVIVTADFAYVRLHGPLKEPYRGAYSPETIARWAEKIRLWERSGTDSYLYFDNTMFGDAITDAQALRETIDYQNNERLTSARLG